MVNFHFNKTEAGVKEALVRQFIKVVSQKEKVALFLSGGSAISLYDSLIPWVRQRKLGSLVVGLADERYAKETDYVDSNFNQINQKSKLFKTLREQKTGLIKILSGNSLEEETNLYNRRLEEIFKSNLNEGAKSAGFLAEGAKSAGFYKVAILGIGADSHTAGILPFNSQAEFEKVFPEHKLVVGYSAHDRYQERITMTPEALMKIDQAVVFALGEAKKQALENLQKKEVSEAYRYPVTLIKSIPQADIFTDQLI